MDFRDFLAHHLVRMDGGMGTWLQAAGLQPGEAPERWNITHSDVIIDIQRQYFDAGSHVVCAHTFGANGLHFSGEELEKIIQSALKNARAAALASIGTQEKFVALDIGPSGKLLKPLGDLPFEDAVALFAEVVRLGVRYGADLIVIETMNDCYETKAALLAAKENSTLPVVVTNAYGADGKLMTGASPAAMVALLEGMGADAIGANCSLGPAQLRPVVEELLAVASVPVVVQPNAGLPQVMDGHTVFTVTPADFAADMAEMVAAGVRCVGGCCGTTPAHIAALTAAVEDSLPVPVADKGRTVVSSYTHAVVFGTEPLLIGERINPTGKSRFKQALREGDMEYVLGEGLAQQERGAHLLDVNVGLPDIDEMTLLSRCVDELQAVTALPLQLDSTNIAAMESALRRYNGKAMINSVNGKAESMAAIFPLVKKYGGVVVALTLDENGIPATADGRVAIAEKICRTAAAYGIAKKDLVFDTLTMAVSADSGAAAVTLEALRRIRQELGCHTVLGVSNVSFGLPNREAVNSTFFALALSAGLSAAIMNPHSAPMRQTYATYRALTGLDENCADYIEKAETFTVTAPSVTSASVVEQTGAGDGSTLQQAIRKGLRERAATLTQELLATCPPLSIVQGEIIPALNEVGKGLEQRTLYLPQLLMSAEAAKASFTVIKEAVGTEHTATGPVFVLATVEGDIHDIGKNIVKLLLENYGIRVVDLGKDVPPAAVLEAVRTYGAPLVGLSALMTTTVPAMEKTICLLREQIPGTRVVVGGAVLTAEYAARIGADHYAADAMETVRYAQSVLDPS